MTGREWTAEQLAKWRIRKADKDEQPPWVRKRINPDSSTFGGAALHPLPPAPPWWVYAPGQTDPSGCWSTHKAAIEQVSDAICNRLVEPYRKDDE
ncbi:hypothetical protein [Mycolicibacterium fortuitum]|uniref:hypothetical protein n=1 Tax=Mycolicibacterium fortuitum TaxID=1766 RepID=UPI001CDBC464|nr:hypothetical protein [Mycolicibacterium fortuitum]UBV14843.1 hypothetical protein H8Z57_29820 [Mycolicibacterium fortuitum]